MPQFVPGGIGKLERCAREEMHNANWASAESALKVRA